ncbi:MAG: Holliday junction resolvase RuvX [Pseudomonadota bacterium]
MRTHTLQELAEILPSRGRLLGLDPGERTIGLAISDRDRRVASPLTTIWRRKFSLDGQELRKLLDEREAVALVIGLPVNMDGSEGPRCQSVRQFARNLIEITELTQPIAFWDERLSTRAVERFMIEEADMTRQQRISRVDKMAAAYILQGALDALKNMTNEGPDSAE